MLLGVNAPRSIRIVDGTVIDVNDGFNGIRTLLNTRGVVCGGVERFIEPTELNMRCFVKAEGEVDAQPGGECFSISDSSCGSVTVFGSEVVTELLKLAIVAVVSGAENPRFIR